MIRSYINILIMLFFSWSVYAVCQGDALLPLTAGMVIIVSILARLRSTDRFTTFEKIPLSVVIILSYLAGMFWRIFVPAPENANSPFLDFTSTLQSASIFFGTLIALRPFTQKNIYRLTFCAWLTVPISMNVPFSENMLFTFAAFAFVSLSIVIINTMNRPSEKKHLFTYAKDYILFAILLTTLTTILFLGIAWSIVVREQAFFGLMGNYIMPRHYTNFLNISPTLNLINPGVSAFDRRPVTEVSLPKGRNAYLKMQVFDEYHNGTWTEPKTITKTILPVALSPDQPIGKIMMFVPLKDLVPAPGGITAVRSIHYLRSQDEIIYADGPQNTRILEFSLSSQSDPVFLSPDQYRKYTALPPLIADDLRKIARSITQDDGNALSKASQMVAYFHHHFTYSLDVSFTADNKGLIKMLNEQRPAYCTYFASALTLLLRAQGIPARVAAGFLTTEQTNVKDNTFLARVNNAHAWTEALLPSYDIEHGQTTMHWQTFDATPPAFNNALNKHSAAYYLERILEHLWLGILRFKATLENMDKDLLRVYVILLLLGAMVFINRQRIIPALKGWLHAQRRTKKISHEAPDYLKTLYGRYEHYLKEAFGEVRQSADTDTDVITRIKQSGKTDKATIAHIETFINAFHAARFGTGSIEQLNSILKELELTTP